MAVRYRCSPQVTQVTGMMIILSSLSANTQHNKSWIDLILLDCMRAVCGVVFHGAIEYEIRLVRTYTYHLYEMYIIQDIRSIALSKMN